MSDSSSSSSSSSSAPKLDNILANPPAPTTNVTPASPVTLTATSSPAVPVSTSTPPPAATTTTTAVTEPTTAVVSPLREDMIKPAVSFLSSPNVRSADKAKKIAFLQKKGLNQAEINESFKRAGDVSTTASTTSTTMTPPVNNYTSPLPQNTSAGLAPVLPSRNNVKYAPTTQIVYYPQPPNPPVPVEKVFAMAVILGMSAVGLTAGVIGLLRRFISPIFNRIAEYQRTRYNQRKEIADKLSKSLQSFHIENDDLDALIDQGEEKTVVDALVKHQSELSSKIDKLVTTSRERISTALKQKTYGDFRSELRSFRNVITNDGGSINTYASYSPHYGRHNSDSPAVSGLKSDIRSLKAVLLNRRNFPTAA